MQAMLEAEGREAVSNFKVGDRVAVYDLSRQVGVVESIKFESITKSGETFPMVGVRVNGGTKYAHPKQCRRLKKKQIQRLWVNAKEAAEKYYWSFQEAHVTSPEASWLKDVVEAVFQDGAVWAREQILALLRSQGEQRSDMEFEHAADWLEKTLKEGDAIR